MSLGNGAYTLDFIIAFRDNAGIYILIAVDNLVDQIVVDVAPPHALDTASQGTDSCTPDLGVGAAQGKTFQILRLCHRLAGYHVPVALDQIQGNHFDVILTFQSADPFFYHIQVFDSLDIFHCFYKIRKIEHGQLRDIGSQSCKICVISPVGVRIFKGIDNILLRAQGITGVQINGQAATGLLGHGICPLLETFLVWVGLSLGVSEHQGIGLCRCRICLLFLFLGSSGGASGISTSRGAGRCCGHDGYSYGDCCNTFHGFFHLDYLPFWTSCWF